MDDLNVISANTVSGKYSQKLVDQLAFTINVTFTIVLAVNSISKDKQCRENPKI